MEDVLEVYQRGYGDNEVLVCLDETSKQQVKRDPSAPSRRGLGRPGSYDYEYRAQRGEQPVHGVRAAGGVAPGGSDGPAYQSSIGRGWSGKLVDEDYPDKDRIVLVMDNLNTHHPVLAVRGVRAGGSAAHRRTVWRFTTRPSMAVG